MSRSPSSLPFFSLLTLLVEKKFVMKLWTFFENVCFFCFAFFLCAKKFSKGSSYLSVLHLLFADLDLSVSGE